MANPHWEERFTEEVPIRDDWSPLGEYGQHGEFEGHLLQDDPSSYTSDWQNYPEMVFHLLFQTLLDTRK